ncbi:MAG: hypothetical protein H0V17_12245 [Deltaproteobacteria bacterium]|nr:hypothetical protein [Deltaproteobacteria bacterium]
MRIALIAWLVALANARADAGSFELSEPAAPPPREIVEQGGEPVYYRLPPQTVHWISRSALGLHSRMTGENDHAFTLDALLGRLIRFGRPSSYGLWIEGGYSYVMGREHLAVFGIGLAQSKPGFVSTKFAIIPHLIAGRIDDEMRTGVRTSLIIANFEIAHQIAFSADRPIHELHLVMTFPFVSGLR